MPHENEGWYQDFLRTGYWLQVNDKKLFYSTSHGYDYVEFFQKWLDLKTPLERDFVGLARPYQFGMDHRYQKDIEERRGSLYIDDDLSAEFVVDLPNGRYNLILGVGYSASLYGGGESGGFNVEIEGQVRKQGLRRIGGGPPRTRSATCNVTDGQMNIRFFCDVRKAMDPFCNHNIGIGWMINYLVILPAEERELMNEWEWKIIKRRGEIIRRVTFVEGDPARTRNEGNFISLNGKPFYFLKVMNNYHPGNTEHYPYYCLATVLSAKHPIRNSSHFFKPDWEKLSYSDDYPWQSIDEMNMTYTWGYRWHAAPEGILSFVPARGLGRGHAHARLPRPEQPLQHPAAAELGPGQGDPERGLHDDVATSCGSTRPTSATSSTRSSGTRTRRATTTSRSSSTGTGCGASTGPSSGSTRTGAAQYTSFDEIVPPEPYKKEWWEFTPEWVNFRKFRGWAQREMVRSACDLVRSLEPEHFSWGAKGDFGTQSWYTGEFVDMFGWYYAVRGRQRRAALRQGGHLRRLHAQLRTRLPRRAQAVRPQARPAALPGTRRGPARLQQADLLGLQGHQGLLQRVVRRRHVPRLPPHRPI